MCGPSPTCWPATRSVGGSTNRLDVPAFRVATLELPEDGTYGFTLFADGDLKVYLAQCSGCPWFSEYGQVNGGRHQWKARGGRYHVRVESGARTASRFSVTVLDGE